jgi:hypothetical protein
VHASEPLCALDDLPYTCEFLIAEKCLLPYPSTVFLREDPSTRTGLRLAYPRQAMPANKDGLPIDPAEWNTLDGFSPGPVIEAFFAQGVDLEASRVPTIGNIARSLETDCPTVLYDAQTGRRVPHFTELDTHASSPASQMLLIRPATRLRNEGFYIVAIRGLIDLDGNPIAAPRPFQILRDGLATPVRVINERRRRMDGVLNSLEEGGIERENLILAWDFIVASSDSITGRALSLRDQGLAANGPGSPPFHITEIEDEVNDDLFRRVRGTFTVPLFMTGPTPPARLNLDANGLPVQNGTAEAPFIVTIPRLAVGAGTANAARPILYGHGLLGSGDEVNAGHLQAFQNRFNFVAGATDWIGMAEEDVAAIIGFIPDLSGFPILPDRLQQAMLNFILLGRLMTAPDGLVSDPAFQVNGEPLIDTEEVYFYGISQGGIAGGTFMALTPDTRRGVLGVGAANYSILLERSTDFEPFQILLQGAYPDELDRQLLLGLIQQLWDRADPQGYLPHLMVDPFPATPPKKLLLQPGLHDSQVPSIGTEIEVRSLLIPSVSPPAQRWFQVPERAAPFDGSAVAIYDVNGTIPPLTNTAPADDNGVHEAVRRLDAAQRQIDAFLRPNGRIENFCEGPCFFRDVPNVAQRD